MAQAGRFVRAAGQQGRPFFHPEADIAGDFFPVLRADQRPHLGVGILRIAHAQAVGALGETFDEFRVDALLNEDARTGGAAFAVDREDGEQRGVERPLDVGVFKDQHRRLAAQFHGEFLQPGAFDDAAAGGGAAGEGDRAYVFMAHQRVAGGGAVALHHVQHPGRNAGLQRQLAQAIGGQRRQFGHLQHRGVAQRQARRGFPGGGHERHVPRRHQRAHPHRLHQRVVEHLVVYRVGLAVHLLAHLGEELEVVRSARDQHIFGLVDRQAGVGGFQFGDLRHVLVDQLAQAAHQARALFHRRVGPLGERLFRRRHRLVYLQLAAGGHLRQQLAVRRVGGGEVLFAGDVLAVDPVVDGFHRRLSS